MMANTPLFFGEGHGVHDDLWTGYGFCPQSPIQRLPAFSLPDDVQCFNHAMAMDGVMFGAFESAFEPRSTLSEGPIKKKDEPVLEETKSARSMLSTEEIMRVAAAQYIQLSSLVEGHPSEIRLPFGLSPSDLTPHESKNVELVNALLIAAELVSNQEYDAASSLLEKFSVLASSTGNPVQRVVHYFAEALGERIKTKTGSWCARGAKEMGAMTHEDVRRRLLSANTVQIVSNKQLPFPQVTHFTAIQTILDNTAYAKRIHIIDLSIKHGHQWTVLIHALASRTDCPVDSLKISAVGPIEEHISVSGERLYSFAKGLGLPFEFRMVVVADVKELREHMFEIEEGETVAMFSSLGFNNLIVVPESLDSLMRVICAVRPAILLVLDVEARLNSQSFITRFSEALFFYSAYFDCIGSLMGGSDESRMMIEGDFLSKGIRSVLATEGSERVVRRVGVKVWKAYFRRFGILEADLSAWSMYQANLLLKQFAKADGSCTLERNGKALTVGWKGTPLHFVSAWKFQNKNKEDMDRGTVTGFEEANLNCMEAEDEPSSVFLEA